MIDELYNELRIIAGEPRLSTADRAKIIEGANQLEQMQRLLIKAQRELIESNQHRLALHERVMALNPPSWSMGSGWVTLQRGPS